MLKKTMSELRHQSNEVVKLLERDKDLIKDMTIREVSAKYGYGIQYCRSRLYKLGISTKPAPRGETVNRELTDSELELAKKLVLQGATGKQLALQLGVNQNRGSAIKTQITRQIKAEEELLSKSAQPQKRKNDYHTHYLQGLGRYRQY